MGAGAGAVAVGGDGEFVDVVFWFRVCVGGCSREGGREGKLTEWALAGGEGIEVHVEGHAGFVGVGHAFDLALDGFGRLEHGLIGGSGGLIADDWGVNLGKSEGCQAEGKEDLEDHVDRDV